MAQKCAMCHAIKGSGGKTASALGGVGAKVTPKPKMSMASYMKTHKLTKTDGDALVAFLMSQK